MKSVILLRHGKSDWNAPFRNDHERPLALRGIKAAKKMGRYLSNIDQVPGLTMSSTALRARNTAELAINAGKWSSDLVLEKKIYESSVETLKSIITKQNDEYDSICLVGHEPTFSSFIERCNDSIWSRFPTASMARIDFNINSWCDIDLKIGTLVWLIRPKELNQ